MEVLLFISAFLAAIAAISSAISASKSYSAAEQANAISKKALDLALHDHKIKILPILTAKTFIPIVIPNSPDMDTISIAIMNQTHSVCNITDVKAVDGNVLIHKATKFPIVIGLNDPALIFLLLPPGIRGPLLVAANKTAAPSLEELGYPDMVMFKLSELIKNFIQRTRFIVSYTDEMGTTYKTYLKYNDEQRFFSGKPETAASKEPINKG